MQMYKTTDFYLACFLKSKRLPLSTIERTNPRRFNFVFDDSEERPELVEDFLFSRASGSINEFVRALKDLKALIYSEHE